jgi:hypothetical protein
MLLILARKATEKQMNERNTGSADLYDDVYIRMELI